MSSNFKISFQLFALIVAGFVTISTTPANANNAINSEIFNSELHYGLRAQKILHAELVDTVAPPEDESHAETYVLKADPQWQKERSDLAKKLPKAKVDEEDESSKSVTPKKAGVASAQMTITLKPDTGSSENHAKPKKKVNTKIAKKSDELKSGKHSKALSKSVAINTEKAKRPKTSAKKLASVQKNKDKKSKESKLAAAKEPLWKKAPGKTALKKSAKKSPEVQISKIFEDTPENKKSPKDLADKNN